MITIKRIRTVKRMKRIKDRRVQITTDDRAMNISGGRVTGTSSSEAKIMIGS